MLQNLSRDKQQNHCKIHRASHKTKKKENNNNKKEFNSTLKEIAGFPFMFYYTLPWQPAAPNILLQQDTTGCRNPQ